MKKTMEEIKKESIEKITGLINNFCNTLSDGTQNPKAFMNINEIEETWSKLQYDTSELYTNMVGELISAIPEREIIAQKKTNFASKE